MELNGGLPTNVQKIVRNEEDGQGMREIRSALTTMKDEWKKKKNTQKPAICHPTKVVSGGHRRTHIMQKKCRIVRLKFKKNQA